MTRKETAILIEIVKSIHDHMPSLEEENIDFQKALNKLNKLVEKIKRKKKIEARLYEI